MAIWPFNRNRNTSPQTKVPEEVEQYYQSERRDRVGVAWLLAGATLIITVLIVLGLFFGGRWAYRKIANKDNKSGTQTAQTNQPTEQSPASQAPSSNNSSSGSPSSGSTSGNTNSQSSTSQGNVAAPTQTNNPSSVPAGPTQTSVPNTGPGETIAVFALVSLAGYLGYASYLRRKLN